MLTMRHNQLAGLPRQSRASHPNDERGHPLGRQVACRAPCGRHRCLSVRSYVSCPRMYWCTLSWRQQPQEKHTCSGLDSPGTCRDISRALAHFGVLGQCVPRTTAGRRLHCVAGHQHDNASTGLTPAPPCVHQSSSELARLMQPLPH
jgi:hypothetical protein